MIILYRTFNTMWFATLVLLLLVQYMRPQELIPGLQGTPMFLPIAALVALFTILAANVRFIVSLPHTQLMLMFLGWSMLMVPFSLSPNATIDGIRDFLPLLPFILAVPLFATNAHSLRKLTDVFLVIASIIATIGILDHGGGRYQMFLFGNFLTDPNDFSLFMVMMFPLALLMFIGTSTWNTRKIFYLFASIVTVVGIIGSYSRGGFLGLVAVSAVLFVYSPNKKAIAGIGAIGLICILALAPPDWIDNVSTSFDTQQSTAQTRLETWKMSVDVFIDHPMGIGMNNIPSQMHHYSLDREHPERWWGNVNHSFWFTTLAEGGLIGTLIITFLLYANVYSCITMGNLKECDEDSKFLKYFGRASLASLVGFLASGTFLTVNYYPHLWYLTALIAAGSNQIISTRSLGSNENT